MESVNDLAVLLVSDELVQALGMPLFRSNEARKGIQKVSQIASQGHNKYITRNTVTVFMAVVLIFPQLLY